MTSIQIHVKGAAAAVTQQGKLTSGMVGVPVTIEYDSAWDGLEKTVVFKSGPTCRNRFRVEGETTVPHEVLERPGMHLNVGIEGRNADGTLVMRTVTAAAGKIYPSLDPSADPSADPSLPIWAELEAMIGDITQLSTQEKSSLVAAVNTLVSDVDALEEREDGAGAVRYTPQQLTEDQQAQARANIGAAKALAVEPTEDDIPMVFFGSALPQTKDDTVMSFRYISKTMDISGYCKTKAQGSSSMSYPKKNQTVKLYSDAECSQKLKVNFKGWGKQHKFCFKANWIDLTHARNIVSARLWGDVVRSRNDYAELPEALRTSPNQGAVDGFPVKVYAGGIYQGRYTINIPKDVWMANMDDELDTHCILCGESNADDRCLFRAEAAIDGSDWTDEVHDAVPNAIMERWNEAIDFVVNSTDEEFAAGIGNYFDVDSLIDYYLFGLASCGLDAFGKNQLFMTYDGQKWFAAMYDMDSTWGLWWDGSGFVSASYDRYEYQDQKDGKGNLLYNRLEALFMDELKARWEELREDALSIANIENRFEGFINICPPWLLEEDFAESTADGAFTGIPLQGTNNIQQIRTYAVGRLAWCDSYVANLGESTALYSLENGTWLGSGSGYAMTITNGNHIRLSGTNATLGDIWLAFDPNDIWNEDLTNVLFSIPNGAEVVCKKINTVVNSGNAPAGNTIYMMKTGGGVSGCGVIFEGDMSVDQVTTVYSTADEDISSISTWLTISESNFDFEFDIELYVNGVRYV